MEKKFSVRKKIKEKFGKRKKLRSSQNSKLEKKVMVATLKNLSSNFAGGGLGSDGYGEEILCFKSYHHSGSSSKCSSPLARKSFVKKLKKDRLLGGGPTNIGTWFL